MSKNIATNSYGQVTFGNVESFGVTTNASGFAGVSVVMKPGASVRPAKGGKGSASRKN